MGREELEEDLEVFTDVEACPGIMEVKLTKRLLKRNNQSMTDVFFAYIFFFWSQTFKFDCNKCLKESS